MFGEADGMALAPSLSTIGVETVQVDLEREERVSCSLKSVHFIS